MSLKGMWTKRFSSNGMPFYYNSTLNKSCWKPPPDAIVLEAENLKRPSDMSGEALEAGEVDTYPSVLDSSSYRSNTTASSTSTPIVAPSENETEKQPPSEDITDRLLQAVANQQKQMKSKRFKSNDSIGISKSEEPLSEYQKLKTLHQTREGSKGDEGSKWLVR